MQVLFFPDLISVFPVLLSGNKQLTSLNCHYCIHKGLAIVFTMSSICANIANSFFFQRFIIVTILLAGIVVGAQTYKEFAIENAKILQSLDRFILLVFTFEVLIKILAEGNRPSNYFKNPWNIFDFVIVTACLLEPLFHLGGAFLPVLRLLEYLEFCVWFPLQLQLLVSCLLKACLRCFVCILLFLLFYILVRWQSFFLGKIIIHFRNLQTSILSLFRVVIEDWTDVMYINKHGSDAYGYSARFTKMEPAVISTTIGAPYSL